MTPAKSVLVADDARSVRTLVRRDVERDGRFTVVGEAGTGEEAVALSRSLQPDAVILDLSLSMRDGADAIENIHQRSPRTKIIAFATLNAGLIRDRAGGADAYLPKPSMASDVHATLTTVCHSG